MMHSSRLTTPLSVWKYGPNRWALPVALALLSTAATVAGAAKKEGADPTGLAAQDLAPPRETAVAVMPFASPAATQLQAPLALRERQTELPRVGVLLNLHRHGFRVLPNADSLSRVPSLTDKALQLEVEDKLAGDLGKPEALEAGKTLGADWVVYGNSRIDIDYRVKAFRLRPLKIVRVDLRVNVVEVTTGEMIWWARFEDEVQGGSASHGVGFTAEDSQKARQLLASMINQAFDEIGKALPEHETGPAVTREQLDEMLGEMGL